jgi:hypothetical protein
VAHEVAPPEPDPTETVDELLEAAVTEATVERPKVIRPPRPYVVKRPQPRRHVPEQQNDEDEDLYDAR